jgi:electron transfer flavoprotein beta subunit
MASVIESQGDQVRIKRDGDTATEVIGATMPLVLSVTDQSGEARYPSFKGIMAAKKKPLDVRPAQLGQLRLTVESMALPPERTGGRIVGEGAEAVPELVRLLRTEAKVL